MRALTLPNGQKLMSGAVVALEGEGGWLKVLRQVQPEELHGNSFKPRAPLDADPLVEGYAFGDAGASSIPMRRWVHVSEIRSVMDPGMLAALAHEVFVGSADPYWWARMEEMGAFRNIADYARIPAAFLRVPGRRVSRDAVTWWDDSRSMLFHVGSAYRIEPDGVFVLDNIEAFGAREFVYLHFRGLDFPIDAESNVTFRYAQVHHAAAYHAVYRVPMTGFDVKWFVKAAVAPWEPDADHPFATPIRRGAAFGRGWDAGVLAQPQHDPYAAAGMAAYEKAYPRR